MNTRRNRPDYFLLNDGIDEEASPEDRLDSSRTVTSLENDVIPSKSVSQIHQLQLESFAEIQVEEFSTIQPESSTSLAPLQEPPRRPDFQNLHPLTSLGHTLTYLNLKIRGWLRKATKES
ncbi:hypothetical protein V1506DRAFT_546745 [Lipomyces tetrasporus]